MADITYSTALKTDYEKLGAVYSLIEQMRLEHNRQGASVSDQGKWYEYQKRFRSLINPLLKEQRELRLRLRRQSLSDEAWRLLGVRERLDKNLEILGDKQALKVLPTEATYDGLDELKAIEIGALDGNFIDPLEDYTTYDETDPDSDLTIAANQITVNTMRGDAGAHVDKDMGAGHFTSFEHLVSYTFSTMQNDSSICIWAVTNSPYWTINSKENNNVGLSVSSYYYGSRYLGIWASDDSDYDYDTISAGTYYLTIVRVSGSSITCYVYSNAARTTLVDTYSCSTDSTAYRYIQACTSDGRLTAYATASGTIFGLDLQEAAGVAEIFAADSAAGQDAKTDGNPAVVVVDNENSTGTDTKAGYPDGEITGIE
jgi:hypothetical protein